jgi:hypothetical protein
MLACTKVAPTPDAIKSDYGWRSAFHEAFAGCYGPSPAYGEDGREILGPVEYLGEVYACAEGEHEGDEWIMAGRLDCGFSAFFALHAGCDYTGWD